MRSAGRLRDRLNGACSAELVGREAELERLAAQLGPSGAVVSFVHGIGGIGKSALLGALEPRLAAAGARVLRLDGRTIEPTARGFLGALATVLGAPGRASAEAIAAELERDEVPSVFLVDEYDQLRLIDDWLRQTLLPALPERTRWYFAGRFAPRSAWLGTPGWSGAVLSLRLGPLGDAAARALLARRGVAECSMGPLLELARGTPLALTLVAGSPALGSGAPAPVDGGESLVLAVLAQRSVQALREPLAAALEAASVVRRGTRDVLVSMLGERCDDALLNELEELSFVELSEEGLTLHETVRHALESRLRARDPERHRQLRRAAFQALERRTLGTAPRGPDAWRLLADLLFLVQHPEIREAFFPSSDSTVLVDAAKPDDRAVLAHIVERHEPPAWAAVFDAWWRLARSGIRVARDAEGRVLGFALAAAAGDLPPELSAHDPLLAAWQAELAAGPGRTQGALLMRRALSLQSGDRLDPVRAAVWLDIKRAYVERPEQWAVYSATRDADATLPLVARLGFSRSPLAWEGEQTLRLVFGPSGIWGWLRALVNAGGAGDLAQAAAPSRASEPAPAGFRPETARPFRLDAAARGLVVGDRAEPLSVLEYRTLAFLLERPGQVVTRDELLDAVWEQRLAGSNVVDAVIRLLRRKLGPHAAELETVRGHGYRIRPAPSTAP